METRCADHVTPLYPQKLALTSPTGGGRSVGIVRVRTTATELSLVLPILLAQHSCNIIHPRSMVCSSTMHEGGGGDDDDEKGDDDNNNNSTPDVDKMASNARLKAGELFPEITGILIAIQDRIISTNNYKKHILKDLNN